MLGDLNIAEPKALIGFAGPRVIEQTIRQKLPEGFQRSEFLLEHGFLDAIVDRRELKATIARSLRVMMGLPRRRRPRRRRRAEAATAVEPARCRPRLPALARTDRHQARPRPDPRAARRARPARSRVPSHRHRRHERQGLGHGDGRARLARGRATAPAATRRRIWSISKNASRSTASRSRRRTSSALAARVERAAAALPAPPSFFEATTALALEAFREARVDVAVLEVGLGGRLDATNVVASVGVAITSIDFDHEAVPRPHDRGDRGREGRRDQAGRTRRCSATNPPVVRDVVDARLAAQQARADLRARRRRRRTP